MDWYTLIDQMETGSVAALARLIARVENRTPGWRGAMKRLYANTGNAATIGITGFPGSGKSTLTGQLVSELVTRGNRVGVIAVDPSSCLSGGAFLGDRIRMNKASALDSVYIRSMSSRGAVGGINQAARDVIKIMDAFGKDYILVETVGIGQDEIDITRATQVVLLVCAPGQGDAIQYLKAGVMEIADIYVANKSDLPESEQVVGNLQSVLWQGSAESGDDPPIMKTNAVKGTGIAILADEVEKRIATPRLRDARRRQSAIEDVKSLLRERFAEMATLSWIKEEELNSIVDDLLTGHTDPYSLADEMIVKSFEQIRLQPTS